MSDPLLAGAAKTRITPPLGTRMAGYRARTSGAAFIYDELFARCVAFETGGRRHALVSLDVMGVEESWVDELRRRLADDLELPHQNLFVAATHTHSAQGGLFASTEGVGEAFNVMMGDGAALFDAVTYENLLRQTDTVVRQAFASLRPCRLNSSRGTAFGIAANRIDRERPADDTVATLHVTDEEEKVVAVVFHFCCHPTTLGEADLGISGDFPGVAAATIERVLGNDSVALYLNGALGDISTRWTRRQQSYNEVQRFALILAGGVISALGTSTPLESPAIDSQEIVVELTQRSPRWVERVAERVAALVGATSHAEQRLLSTAREGLESATRSGEVIASLPSVPVRLQLLSFGDELTFLGVPGEPFSSLARALDNADQQRTIAVVAPANGYMGYFPDARAFDEGGYEVGCSLVDRGTLEEIAEAAQTLVGARR